MRKVLALMVLFCGAASADAAVAQGAYYNETGMGDGDWWLEVRSFSEPDEWDKIALVFGTVDDYQACTDIAKAERARVLALGVPYPAEYRCTPANR
jgi:hypothetical protein